MSGETDRRTVEIAIRAEIADLVGPLSTAAGQVEATANRVEASGKKLDAAAATNNRSLGLMGRAVHAYSNKVTQFGKASASLAKHREQVDKISTSWMVAGGVISAGVGASVMVLARFDKAMSGVAATGADARNNLDSLRKTAVQAGMSTAYGATQAADGITQLLKAGLSADDVIKGSLTASLNLAAADNLELARSSEIVATALSQFELKGKDAGHVADLLAAGAGKAQGGVEDLANGLKYIGPVAHGMNVSVDETVGALAALASQGILSEQAGTSLRGVLSSLTSPSKQAAAVIDDLGISLYDSQGRFQGLKNVAGQLDKAFAHMTDAERDHYLGVIFGNAQLTTARILFKKGAQGIGEWTDAVNESGYAQRAAAIQLDNLMGDFKKLQGVSEAVAISSGSGVNGMLRDLTQGATGAVRAVGQVPTPVLEAGTRIAAIAGIGLLAGGGLMKFATATAASRQAMVQLRNEAPGVANGLEKTSKWGKRAAVALAALQVASVFGGTIQAGIDKLNGSMGDMAFSAASVAGPKGLGALDSEFQKVQGRFFFWRTGTAQAKGFGDALRQVNDSTEGFGLFQNTLAQTVAGMFGTKTAATELQEQVGKLDSSLAGMDPTQAKMAFSQITKEAIAQGISVDKLSTMFPEYKATLQSVATQLGVTELSAQDWVDWMGGKVPEAVKKASEANPTVVSALGDTEQAALDGKDALKQVTDALWGYANAKLKLSGTKMGFEGAIDDAMGTAKKNQKAQKKAGSTSLNHAVNRENKRALDQLATSSQNYVNTLIAQEGKGKHVADVMTRAREKYVATAQAMGYSATEASKMADEMGLIPDDVRTEVRLTGADATNAQAETLKDAIKGLPKEQQTKVESVFEEEGVRNAYIALAKVDKKKADAWIISMLNRGAVDKWEKWKPETKDAKIKPSLTTTRLNATVAVHINRAVANGGLFEGRGMVQRFADGGFAGSIGTKQPQIQRAGGKGLNWAEDGAGPWEAFISGHPLKRKRSRMIASDVVARLGGVASFADGGYARGGRPQAYTGAFQRAMLQPTTVINYNVRTTAIYPQAEPTSVTQNRGLALAANIGR